MSFGETITYCISGHNKSLFYSKVNERKTAIINIVDPVQLCNSTIGVQVTIGGLSAGGTRHTYFCLSDSF